MKLTAHETVKPVPAVRPQALAASANGLEIDRKGFEEALIAVSLGAVTGTTPTLDVKVQETDTTGTGYADVSGGTFSQKVAADANKIFTGRLDLEPRKRFLRLVFTVAGTTPVFNVSAEAVLLVKKTLPVSQENAIAFNLTS